MTMPNSTPAIRSASPRPSTAARQQIGQERIIPFGIVGADPQDHEFPRRDDIHALLAQTVQVEHIVGQIGRRMEVGEGIARRIVAPPFLVLVAEPELHAVVGIGGSRGHHLIEPARRDELLSVEDAPVAEQFAHSQPVLDRGPHAAVGVRRAALVIHVQESFVRAQRGPQLLGQVLAEAAPRGPLHDHAQQGGIRVEVAPGLAGLAAELGAQGLPRRCPDQTAASCAPTSGPNSRGSVTPLDMLSRWRIVIARRSGVSHSVRNVDAETSADSMAPSAMAWPISDGGQ